MREDIKADGVRSAVIVFSMLSIDDVLAGPDPTQFAAIRAEIGEDERTFASTLDEFRAWVAAQDYLPTDFEPHILEVYLRGTKCQLPVAKRKFVNYFVGHEKMSDLYSFEFTDAEDKIVRNTIAVPSRRLTSLGYRVAFFGLYESNGAFDLSVCCRKALQRLTFILNVEKPIAGELIFADLANVSYFRFMKSLMKYPSLLSHAQHILVNFPFRVKLIGVVNATPLLVRLVHFIKWILPPKLQKRLVFLSSVKEIIEIAGAECVPEDYGGTAPSIADIDALCYALTDAHSGFLNAQKAIRIKGQLPKNIDYGV